MFNVRNQNSSLDVIAIGRIRIHRLPYLSAAVRAPVDLRALKLHVVEEPLVQVVQHVQLHVLPLSRLKIPVWDKPAEFAVDVFRLLTT